jgi:hypothetical protein
MYLDGVPGLHPTSAATVMSVDNRNLFTLERYLADFLSIEEYQQYNTYGDAGISEIENRTEEYELLSAP